MINWRRHKEFLSWSTWKSFSCPEVVFQGLQYKIVHAIQIATSTNQRIPTWPNLQVFHRFWSILHDLVDVLFLGSSQRPTTLQHSGSRLASISRYWTLMYQRGRHFAGIAFRFVTKQCNDVQSENMRKWTFQSKGPLRTIVDQYGLSAKVNPRDVFIDRLRPIVITWAPNTFTFGTNMNQPADNP